MISQFLSIQASIENKKLSEKLYNEMNANFLEHTMYDINDALTSILAICDMEEMENIPKVKQYIQRINSLLNDVQVYQGNAVFNINHILGNVIDVIKDHFKSKVTIRYAFSEIKPFVKTNKAQLERILLYIFIELIAVKQGADPLDISVHLHQKEQDARIIIGNTSCDFSKTAIDEISHMQEGFKGNIQISPKEQGVEINIKIPLSFKKATKKACLPSVSVSEIRTVPGKPVIRPRSSVML